VAQDAPVARERGEHGNRRARVRERKSTQLLRCMETGPSGSRIPANGRASIDPAVEQILPALLDGFSGLGLPADLGRIRVDPDRVLARQVDAARVGGE